MVRRVVLSMAVMVVALFVYAGVRAQATASPTIASLDFDNNGKADIAFFKRGDGRYYVLQAPAYSTAFAISSSSGTAPSDVLMPVADYNGDGVADTALFRAVSGGTAASAAGTWTIQLGPSFSSSTSVAWGIAADTPLAADWDGDGRFDLGVWRPAERKLYVLQGGTNFTSAFTITWGIAGDRPLPGDFDGDGRIDFAVFRPAEQRVYVLQGAGYTSAFSFAFSAVVSQTFLPGDYDGDGRLDFATYTPTTLGPSNVAGTWTVAQGGNSFATQFSKAWGTTGDTPVPGDFDGDGRLDIAVWRPSEGRFFVLQAGSNYTTAFSVAWGSGADIPLGVRNPVQNTNF